MTSIVETKSPSNSEQNISLNLETITSPNPKPSIIYKNGKKYKIFYPSEYTRLACIYEGCEHIKTIGSYCALHKDGVVNTKPEKTEEEKNILREKSRLTSQVGDQTEIFVENILENMEELEEYERIGYTNDRVDIKYKFKNEDFFRGIQVRTLQKEQGRKNKWRGSERPEYEHNTLCVLVNQERDKFVLIYSQDYPKSGLSVHFSGPNSRSKYKNNLYIDFNKFKEDLLLGMKTSVIYKECLSLNYIKEKESKIRLNNVCNDQKLNFDDCKISGSIYDCKINNFHVQCKYTSDSRSSTLFVSHISKSGGIIREGKKSKRLFIPYNENDQIDFVAIEVSTLLGHFYVIPKTKLVQEGIFSSSKNNGKAHIVIPTPDYKGSSKYKWLLEYYNRWDLLKL
jgi:hypothetical protein